MLSKEGMKLLRKFVESEDTVIQFSMVSAIDNGTKNERLPDDDEQLELRKARCAPNRKIKYVA